MIDRSKSEASKKNDCFKRHFLRSQIVSAFAIPADPGNGAPVPDPWCCCCCCCWCGCCCSCCCCCCSRCSCCCCCRLLLPFAAAAGCCHCCWNGPKIAPISSQNGSNMVPKWPPNGSQIASWSPLEASWALEALLEPSWKAPGGLLGALGVVLEASWPLLGRSWGGLGGALGRSWGGLGAKRLPKWRARGSESESKRRLRPQTRILQKPLSNSMNFKVPGSSFGRQNQYKMASNTIMGE